MENFGVVINMIRENWQWRNIPFWKIYTKQEILYFAISYNEISSLTDFIPLGSFYTPWKHQEISSFLMFDVYRLGDWEGIESDRDIELVNILLVLGESVNSPLLNEIFHNVRTPCDITMQSCLSVSIFCRHNLKF